MCTCECLSLEKHIEINEIAMNYDLIAGIRESNLRTILDCATLEPNVTDSEKVTA